MLHARVSQPLLIPVWKAGSKQMETSYSPSREPPTDKGGCCEAATDSYYHQISLMQHTFQSKKIFTRSGMFLP